MVETARAFDLASSLACPNSAELVGAWRLDRVLVHVR